MLSVSTFIYDLFHPSLSLLSRWNLRVFKRIHSLSSTPVAQHLARCPSQYTTLNICCIACPGTLRVFLSTSRLLSTGGIFVYTLEEPLEVFRIDPRSDPMTKVGDPSSGDPTTGGPEGGTHPLNLPFYGVPPSI